ncbi:BadF/BadG/BcrA/BcrD ATPase family protein [Shimia biformata]|uniref:BadF/BadG/BcrA/BcrD ATPase family protein n=1 Tax=Shimia biformata TaxID=1294299 RepID=UPI0019528C79|nr:BadF/BadG/BcrA/BcrD ATPase family protein [Shimia biformata]
MTKPLHNAVLAIDGGGTRCRIAVSDGQNATIEEMGAANVTTSFDGAVAEIREGLNRLAARLQTQFESLAALPCFAGMAGITGPEIAGRLENALPFSRIRVMDDRPAALRGAVGDSDGVVVHCGTGSFVAAKLGGAMRFCGGWGSILGDEASAQWIGRRALSVTLDTVDGLRPETAMTSHFLATLDGSAGIVRFAATATPTAFGKLAPTVTEHAVKGDALAVAVMQAGADYAVETAARMGWTQGVPLYLTGGIGPHFAPYLPADMQSQIRQPLGVPLDGAIALAREVANDNH